MNLSTAKIFSLFAVLGVLFVGVVTSSAETIVTGVIAAIILLPLLTAKEGLTDEQIDDILEIVDEIQYVSDRIMAEALELYFQTGAEDDLATSSGIAIGLGLGGRGIRRILDVLEIGAFTFLGRMPPEVTGGDTVRESVREGVREGVSETADVSDSSTNAVVPTVTHEGYLPLSIGVSDAVQPGDVRPGESLSVEPSYGIPPLPPAWNMADWPSPARECKDLEE